jgi:hypothetical protein
MHIKKSQEEIESMKAKRETRMAMLAEQKTSRLKQNEEIADEIGSGFKIIDDN